MDETELRRRAREWMDADPDPRTRAELEKLLAAPDLSKTDLADRFAGELDFGTAGLRGVMGAGPNRMNRAVVARATWGLAQRMLAEGTSATERGVVVGGDARHMSAELSEDTAAILAAAGIRVWLFRHPVPTPLVGFAVKHLGAAAGVVVTASHNPPEYNGYKVYWSNGAQIIPPVDGEIAAQIRKAPPARAVERPPSLDVLLASGRLAPAPASVDRDYLDAVRGLAVHPGQGDRSLTIVYTPMHGVGDDLARRALAEAGFARVTSVPEQQKPDGDFPTVAFPNPEEKGAMDLSFALGKKLGADLVIANDPDADRLSLAVPVAGGFRQLTGNEVGVLLGHYLLTEKPPRTTGGPRAVLASIVSSPQLGHIAKDLGVRYEETLTGFKWLANLTMALEKQGVEVVLGYEEALGYSVGDVVRDKDGISAAVVAAEMAAVLRGRGKTLLDELEVIARRWGYFTSGQVNVVRKGASGQAELQAMMERLRKSPPAEVAGDAVVAVSDYDAGTRTDRKTGQATRLTLPKSNVLTFELASGNRIIARPSGTEPKAKLYFDVREPVREGEAMAAVSARALATLEGLKRAFSAYAEGSSP